jgi:hypothetical protein
MFFAPGLDGSTLLPYVNITTLTGNAVDVKLGTATRYMDCK